MLFVNVYVLLVQRARLLPAYLLAPRRVLVFVSPSVWVDVSAGKAEQHHR